MRLFYSSPSPFAAKARMALHLCGVAAETVKTDTTQEPADLLAANPLGKIPVLVLDDGSAVYDSAVICDYLDRISGGTLFPRETEAWLAAKRLEALVDGITEAVLLTVYEVRYRPEEKRYQGWVDKQDRKAARGLELVSATIGEVPAAPQPGHLALAALIGWVNLRFEDRIARDHASLAAWFETFRTRFPDLVPLLPAA